MKQLHHTCTLIASTAILAILLTSHAMAAPLPPPNGGGNPFWAPDGRKVAFVSATANSPVNLWVVDLASNHYRQITNLGGRFLGWSPDSKTIYYRSHRNGRAATFAAPLTGAPERPVFTFVGEDAIAVAPAPDGSRVAYIRRAGDARDLWVADWDGANQRQITKDLMVRSASWRPDSKALAYDEGGIIGQATYVVPAAGGDPKPVFKAMGNWPSWSPDGKRLVVLGMHAMTVIKADGSGNQRLHVSQDDRGPLSWSPDGKLIAYTCVERGSHGIATVTADTGKSVTLSPGWTQAGFPRWAPDGHALIFNGARPDSPLGNVFVLNVKSKLYRPLTTASASHWSPWRSGDGKATFFLSNGIQAGAVTLCRTTPGGTVPLIQVDPRYDLQFSWPHKASSGLLVNGPTIWVLFASAAPRVLLTTEHPTSADLSPAGDQLVYVKWLQHQPSLVVRQLQGGSEQELLPPPAAGLAYSKLAWSPRGDAIAFVRGDALCKVALSDKNTSVVWQAASEAAVGTLLAPRWSPDGQRLAFGRFLTGTAQRLELQVVEESGQHPQAVATTTIVAEHGLYADPLGLPYDWSPAGRLAYCLEKDGTPALYVVDPARSPLRPSLLRADAAYPSWIGDTEIIYTALSGNQETTARVTVPAITGGS